MKPVLEIARVFLRARAGVVLADQKVAAGKVDPLSPVGREYLSGVRDALAFVLDVDLHQMNAPKVAGQVEPPKRVQLSWIDAYGCWFVEFPPDEMQARQQYRAEFLSRKQAFELLDALRDQVLGQLMLTPADWEARQRADAALRAEAGRMRPVVQLDQKRAGRSSTAASSGVAGEGDLPQGA